MLGWTPGNFDITNPARELLGEGAFNWGRWRNERAEQIAAEIGTLSPENPRRQELARQYGTIFREVLPMIPLHQEPQIFGVRETVSDVGLRQNEDVELRGVRMRR